MSNNKKTVNSFRKCVCQSSNKDNKNNKALRNKQMSYKNKQRSMKRKTKDYLI